MVRLMRITTKKKINLRNWSKQFVPADARCLPTLFQGAPVKAASARTPAGVVGHPRPLDDFGGTLMTLEPSRTMVTMILMAQE